jgi:hypothetical protein
MAGGKALAETLTTKADIVAALESRGREFAERIERMTDAELAEQFSACMRSINTDPTMPRQPTKPTLMSALSDYYLTS